MTNLSRTTRSGACRATWSCMPLGTSIGPSSMALLAVY